MKNKKMVNMITALMATALVAASCGQAPPVEEKEVIRPVRYAAAAISEKEKTRTFSGKSKSGADIKLSFRIDGQVEKLPVKVGDRIKKGDLIASLDDRDDQIKLEELRSAIASARVQKESAQSNLKRIRTLYENNNISLREYESARSQFASSSADLSSRIKQYDLQKSRLSYSTLKSPVDGVISAVNMEENETVAGGTAVVEISSGKQLKISVGVPEDYISQISTGDKARAKFFVHKDKSFEGTVSEISYVGAASAVYPVTVVLDETPAGIRPGMPADVTFFLSTSQEEDKLLVPASAVGEDTGGHYVFLVTPEKEKGYARVQKIRVSIGSLVNEGFEITEGINPGDLVVISGISKITSGMKVKISLP